MKRIALSLALSATTIISFAQGFYFRAGMGYAFPLAGQTMDANATPYNGTYNNTTGSYSMSVASFGAGLQSQLGLGYMFNRHVGAQLDLQVGVAPKKYSFTATDILLPGGYPGNITFTMKAKGPVLLTPSVVLQNGGDLWNFYTRFGLVVPLSTKLIKDEIQVNAPGTGAQVVDDFTFEVTNSFSLGMTAAAGVQYKINERMSVWGELSFISLSAYVKQQKLTAVTENGMSYPLSVVSGNQVINYSKSVAGDTTGANQPTYSQPFSNVGFSFGLRFALFGNSKNPSRPAAETPKRPKPAHFR